ncbi:MAG: CvpA family protein [Clostridia bacterium]|nr:CvpA family protein [Clostridia bacterium]
MYLWILFDIIVLAVFLICIVHASKKGLIRASYGIVSIVLTIVLMAVFQDRITEAVKKSPFGQNAETKIEQALNENLSKSNEESEEEKNEIKFGLPLFLKEFTDNKTEMIEQAKTEFVKETAESISASLINIVSIVVLYFLIRLVLFILLRITDAVFKLPLLKTVNKLGGALLGIINALFIIYILCAALIWFIPGDSTGAVKEAVNQTYITKYFYNDNLLLKFFMK